MNKVYIVIDRTTDYEYGCSFSIVYVSLDKNKCKDYINQNDNRLLDLKEITSDIECDEYIGGYCE
jgi:hypothetical protein